MPQIGVRNNVYNVVVGWVDNNGNRYNIYSRLLMWTGSRKVSMIGTVLIVLGVIVVCAATLFVMKEKPKSSQYDMHEYPTDDGPTP